MSRPSDYNSLAQYCLQQLGSPVIDIQVADEQIQNRIDDAFDFFREFHGQATERMFLKHVIMDNQIAIASASSFKYGETVTGSVSGTTATVTAVPLQGQAILQVGTPVGSGFIATEQLTGSQSGSNGVITSYTTGDIDNGWIPVSSAVLSIANVYPIAGGANSNSQFSASYQIKVNDIYNFQSSSGQLATGGLAYYEETKDYLNTMDSVLLGQQIFRYNPYTGRLYIDFDWRDNVTPGYFILADTYSIVDETVFDGVWNDRMLKKLATAYIKKQWGTNLKLYGGVQLPGGIVVNGQTIYDEAVEECDKLEDQIRDIYQEPVGFLVG